MQKKRQARVIKYKNKRHFSSERINNKLHPWFITDFTDGEGSFSIRTRTKPASQLGFHVSIVYSIKNNRMKDSLALQSLKFINKYSKDKAYKITDINKRNLSSQVRKLHP